MLSAPLEPGREELLGFSRRAETLESELEASRGMEAQTEQPRLRVAKQGSHPLPCRSS